MFVSDFFKNSRVSFSLFRIWKACVAVRRSSAEITAAYISLVCLWVLRDGSPACGQVTNFKQIWAKTSLRCASLGMGPHVRLSTGWGGSGSSGSTAHPRRHSKISPYADRYRPRSFRAGGKGRCAVSPPRVRCQGGTVTKRTRTPDGCRGLCRPGRPHGCHLRRAPAARFRTSHLRRVGA